MFVLSKLLAWFIEPLHWCLLLTVAALITFYKNRKRLATYCLSAMLICFSVIGFTPIAGTLLSVYETAYQRPNNLDNLQGVIALGGSINSLMSRANDDIAFTGSVERLFTLAAFAKSHPAARLVHTGGSGYLLHQEDSEAHYVKQFFKRLGIPTNKLLLEARSRNTYENALYTKNLLAQDNITIDGTWLLVTSAYHMPRAMRTFTAQNINVTPYPVDYRTTGGRFVWNRPLYNHHLMSLFLHETLGSLAYMLYN